MTIRLSVIVQTIVHVTAQHTNIISVLVRWLRGSRVQSDAPVRPMSNSVHVHFGTTGYTTSVHVQFGTPEVQFGTSQILECNSGTPQGRFR